MTLREEGLLGLRIAIKSYFTSIEHSKNKSRIRIFNTRVKLRYLLFKLLRLVSMNLFSENFLVNEISVSQGNFHSGMHLIRLNRRNNRFF